jgi:hypothetical protein
MYVYYNVLDIDVLHNSIHHLIILYTGWCSTIFKGFLYSVGIRYMESFDIIFFSYTLHGCVSVYL